jgi:hypothetical protein
VKKMRTFDSLAQKTLATKKVARTLKAVAKDWRAMVI